MAIAFHATSGKSVNEVLFSGQSALPGLVTSAGSWSISALLLVLAFKGLAGGASLGSFRGGPTFPAMFIGAAAGILASHLPGFDRRGTQPDRANPRALASPATQPDRANPRALASPATTRVSHEQLGLKGCFDRHANEHEAVRMHEMRQRSERPAA